MMSDLKETLKLTDTQARQVKDIQTKTMAAMQPYHEKMAGQEQAIAQAMKADKVDAAAVKQLVAEAGATMTACRQTMVDGQLALKGVLTPEQYGRLPECSMHASMMGGMAHGVAVQTPAAGETGTDHSQHHK
jgi:Spy/CpxP family protein refolding chaperone